MPDFIDNAQNHSTRPAQWGSSIVLACLLLMVSTVYSASMRFESAGTYVKNNTYYLDSFARLDLGDAPAKALANGVELYFLVEIAVHKNRRWWIDTPVIERRLRYRLYYYDLTRHYRVENMQSGKSTNFRSLAAALRKLGRLNQYALMPVTQIDERDSYTASIKVELDRTRLPGPLMAQALVSKEWQLESEVFRWLLN
ncbi:hypothetical protein AB833_23700 [Chromatiales bacterium (ex Bugula neritina AB1)]|nr:hypothetical protein AB833_23700 [Chromatiales bacterium (ex Bugula neritina AB1)]